MKAAASPIRYPQLAKEPFLTSHMRGNPTNRFWAKGTDLILVVILSFIVSFFGHGLAGFVPLVFFATMDRWGRGQSPGKWIMGLHTISVEKGTRASIYNCLVRNLPFLFLFFGLHLPETWGTLMTGFAIAWILLELYFMVVLRSGLRVGDVLGHTRVFDYKDEHTKFIEEFLKEEALS